MLQDANYSCNDYNDFALPPGDELFVAAAGQSINQNDLLPAMATLRAELAAYEAMGGDLDPAPGREAVGTVIAKLDTMLEKLPLNLSPDCDPEGQGNDRCISDREALDVELQATDLVRALEVAGNNGAWVRQWQSCMVHTIKFRIDLSIHRVEFICGRNAPVSRYARTVQDAGLNLVSQDRDAEALAYYSHVDQACAMVEVYEGCLVPAFEENLPYDGPLECDDGEE